MADADEYDAALLLCDQAPDDQEDPGALMRVRAIVLHAADRHDEAARLEAEFGSPASALEAYFASLGASRDGKPDAERRALEQIRRAFVFMPGANETYLERLLLCSFGVPDAGTEELQDAAEALEVLFPDSALAWFYIGLARSKTNPAYAREATRRAIDLDVGLAQPYVIEHLFIMAEGDFDGAREMFERAIALTPDGSPERQRLLLVRARACLQHLRSAEALDAAERALAIPKAPIEALLLKAQAQFGSDRAAAEATLRRVLELDPENAKARRLLGG
jgi:tetratricopeptide (TPR) repeat protein